MRRLALWCVRAAGWTIEGERPPFPKFVAIGAPHTSNWDFVFFLAVTSFIDVKARFIGKHTLFRWPLGVLMRAWGGIAVRRDSPDGLVDQTVAAIEEADEAALVIAPEGTRSWAPFWKSGFYRIAVSARVPILLVRFDYRTKTVIIGPLFEPSGDYDRDLPLIQREFRREMARIPGNYGAEHESSGGQSARSGTAASA